MAVIDIVRNLQKIKAKLNNDNCEVELSISSNGNVAVWMRFEDSIEIIGRFKQEELTVENVLSTVMLNLDKINNENNPYNKK